MLTTIALFSVLSVLSKILERHVTKYLMKFFQKQQILDVAQFGSRPNLSCETLLLHLTDKWLKSMDNSELTGLVLVDFRKAFDLVNQDLSLQKLSTYGVLGQAHRWFTSYLKGRKQVVSIGNCTSELTTMQFGIPQGSCLGPLMFITFVNDIPLINKECLTYMYVDPPCVCLAPHLLTLTQSSKLA